MYKVYYWLTLLLFLLMFIMAAWFVALVAVNTTGELQCDLRGEPPPVSRCRATRLRASCAYPCALS